MGPHRTSVAGRAPVEDSEFLGGQRALHQSSRIEAHSLDEGLAAKRNDTLNLDEFARIEAGDYIADSKGGFTLCHR